MKNVMAGIKGGSASGMRGVFGRVLAKKRAETAARAAAGTPAHNAQADPTITPMSEEERKRRRSSTVLNPTDKLG